MSTMLKVQKGRVHLVVALIIFDTLPHFIMPRESQQLHCTLSHKLLYCCLGQRTKYLDLYTRTLLLESHN